MEIQISSGGGPAECELAVGKLLQSLMQEFPDIKVLERIPGKRKGCFKSVRISSDMDLTFLEGSIKWICISPFRKKHKRKNWFVDVSICAESEALDFDKTLVKFETFRSGGRGGQHVNKVETGVRATYIPTGLSVISTDGRSQYMNKQIALNRLCNEISKIGEQNKASAKALNRLEHYRLERGNAVRVYSGMEFRRI